MKSPALIWISGLRPTFLLNKSENFGGDLLFYREWIFPSEKMESREFQVRKAFCEFLFRQRSECLGPNYSLTPIKEVSGQICAV